MLELPCPSLKLQEIADKINELSEQFYDQFKLEAGFDIYEYLDE